MGSLQFGFVLKAQVIFSEVDHLACCLVADRCFQAAPLLANQSAFLFPGNPACPSIHCSTILIPVAMAVNEMMNAP